MNLSIFCRDSTTFIFVFKGGFVCWSIDMSDTRFVVYQKGISQNDIKLMKLIKGVRTGVLDPCHKTTCRFSYISLTFYRGYITDLNLIVRYNEL